MRWLMSQDVDIFATDDRLAVTTDSVLEPGVGLVIHTPGDTFWAQVVRAERADWGRHNWLVDVESARMDDLRKALTYQVVERAPDPPEYEGPITITGKVRALTPDEWDEILRNARG